MNTFQLIAIPACILFAAIAIVRRKPLLTLRQNLFWVFLWTVAATVVALPNIASIVAHFLGIGRGADLVLYVLCFATILYVRYAYHRQRRIEIALTELVRNDALNGARSVAIARPGDA